MLTKFSLDRIRIVGHPRWPFEVELSVWVDGHKEEGHIEGRTLQVGLRHLISFQTFQGAAAVDLGDCLAPPFDDNSPLTIADEWMELVDRAFIAGMEPSRGSDALPEKVNGDGGPFSCN